MTIEQMMRNLHDLAAKSTSQPKSVAKTKK